MQIFGILNITEDSFSDGGRYLDPERSVAHANALLEDGANIVDVGPASSHPDSAPVSSEIQIDRLRPILASGIDLKRLSIDCTSINVQRFAIEKGAGYLNDIRGFGDPALYPQLADSDTRLIVMHSVSGTEIANRVDVPPSEILHRIFAFFDRRVDELTAAGISPDRIVLDPGMGFFLGTNPSTSLEILRRLPELRQRYSLPVLVSVSRKSFLQFLSEEGAKGGSGATLAAEIFCIESGVDFVRTHDPKQLRQAVSVWSELRPR